MNSQDDLDLTTIPLKHPWWHTWSLQAARVFVWFGFWIAVFVALQREDWMLFAVSLMLLGIGLLIFRGVAYFMNVWIILSQYISAREIREEMELKGVDEELEF